MIVLKLKQHEVDRLQKQITISYNRSTNKLTPDKIAKIKSLINKRLSVKDICDLCNVTTHTVKYVREYK